MTLFLVRHASAGSRGSLGPDADLDRPLDALGLEQATIVATLLSGRSVKKIYSSRAVRCVQTVEPLAALLGIDVEAHPALLEGQTATMAVHLARELAADDTTAVISSHGDIIPDMVQTLAREGMVIVGPRAWAKGSTWELRTRGGDITEAEFLGPY
jgi:phosphohistidine phosphatase SixA